MYSLYLCVLLYSSSVSFAAPARLTPSQTLTSTPPESTTTLPNSLLVRSELPLTTMFWQYSGNMLDSDDSESENLPPVSVVFMSMAANQLATLSESPSASTSTSHAAFLSTSPYAQSTPAPMETPFWGPGPAIAFIPSSTNPSTPFMPANQAKPSVSTDKLAIIGSVIGGITALTLCIVLLASPRGCCYRKKVLNPERKLKDGEKALPIPSWLKSNSSEETAEDTEKVASKQLLARIIDIKPDFPRSKFSVTSSDYPYSIRSSTCVENVSTPPIVDDLVTTPPSLYFSIPLLTPAEFFSLPSAPNVMSSSASVLTQHSRTQSAPVFGHRRHPEPYNKRHSERPSEHNKSKSVSVPFSIMELESEWDITRAYATPRSDKARSVVVVRDPRTGADGEASRRNWI
jgi:hypothetical protein